MGVVYIARNAVNGKCYIGKTIQEFERRKRSHYRDAENRSNPLSIFHRARTKAKISSAKKGRPSPSKGRKQSDAAKVKMKQAWLHRKARGEVPFACCKRRGGKRKDSDE